MPKIKIENLKNIKNLEFQIPTSGVHILTSVNGSGKTTLLTCLERLVNPYAFQRHFKTSSNNQFDNFQSAKIIYSHNGSSVTYKYKNTNWSPTPKKGSVVLKSMGFGQVVYLASSGERFYVQNQELDTSKIIFAPQFFKDGMNEIFQTTKFNELRRVKLSGKGRGNSRRNFGFLLPTTSQGGQSRYFTERNFSLGEILMLNALSELVNVSNNALVLIDEVELALHPRVQVRLLNYLQRIATQKSLTIIISTHSSSLIKAAPKLIYLERKPNGIVEIEYNCYPAIALQNVAVQEEVQPDFVFFVEDDFAKFLLEELINYYFTRINIIRRPIIKTLPVAGYKQTIKLVETSCVYLIPANTKVFCFLDLDVQVKYNQLQAKVNKTTAEQSEFNLFTTNAAMIKYLPITAELGIINILNQNPNQHIQPLQTLFNGVFDISQIILDEQNRGLNYSPNPRTAAKEKIKYYIERIRQATNFDETRIKIMLCQYYASLYGQTNTGNLQGLFNPLFN